MKENKLWLLLLLPCLLGACRTAPVAGVPAGEAGAAFKKPVEWLYPPSFRAQHRVTLTFRGRQLDFSGYLIAKRPGAWRAVAFGEFGGSLFDIAALPGKSAQVLKKPRGIPDRWLRGPAADILEIISFSEVPAGSPETPFSVTRRGEVYNLGYSDYADFPGAAHALPRHIVVENEKMKLRLEVDLVKFESVEIPESNFIYE